MHRSIWKMLFLRFLNAKLDRLVSFIKYELKTTSQHAGSGEALSVNSEMVGRRATEMEMNLVAVIVVPWFSWTAGRFVWNKCWTIDIDHVYVFRDTNQFYSECLKNFLNHFRCIFCLDFSFLVLEFFLFFFWSTCSCITVSVVVSMW